jgi:hypothetical protein
MMKTTYALALATLAVTACASTSTTHVSRNQIIINTSAAPACGSAGATRVASRMAAVETLRNGFERFIIQGAGQANNVSVINRPPTGAYTTGTFNTFGNTTYGNATTTYTGGGPMLVGQHDANLLVLMLNPGDAGFSNGVDAKRVLGDDWEKLVERGIRTC